MNNEDIFRGVGVEVELPTPDSFLKIKETLTRIGISSRKDRKLFQSCHILHKKGRYSILHFKELFILDGKQNTFGEEDQARARMLVKHAKRQHTEIVDWIKSAIGSYCLFHK